MILPLLVRFVPLLLTIVGVPLMDVAEPLLTILKLLASAKSLLLRLLSQQHIRCCWISLSSLLTPLLNLLGCRQVLNLDQRVALHVDPLDVLGNDFFGSVELAVVVWTSLVRFAMLNKLRSADESFSTELAVLHKAGSLLLVVIAHM